MMLETLAPILRTVCKLDPEQPVLVGVSGGPDSLALLDILLQAGYPVIVAHFNHRLRPESDSEVEAVRQHAARLGTVFSLGAADVRAYAQANALSLEEAARKLRYGFLFQRARERGAQAVAVGHTADDQVETVLMHFIRGAGLAGLKGMTYRTILKEFDADIPLVRPLLGVWRREVEAHCARRGLEPHTDPTNAEQTFFRNRLRHSLIPQLEAFNPRFKEAVLRSAAALEGDHAVQVDVIDSFWEQCVERQGDGYAALVHQKTAGLPAGIMRGLIRRAAELLRPSIRDVGYAALERAVVYIQNAAPGRVDLAEGLFLTREGDLVYLSATGASLPSEHWPQLVKQLSADRKQWTGPGGELDLGAGWRISIEQVEVPPPQALARADHDPFLACLDAGRFGSDLVVRTRRAGDRFQPLGMENGSMKLSDFFINEKLPARARQRWPLVCCGDEIAWIPGFRLAHPFRVTDKTSDGLQLKLSRLEK